MMASSMASSASLKTGSANIRKSSMLVETGKVTPALHNRLATVSGSSSPRVITVLATTSSPHP